MKKLYLLLFSMLMSGCVMPPTELDGAMNEDNVEKFAPPQINYDVAKQSHGSLYAGRASLSLYKDRRAYRVGDILTVMLDEKTESKKSASSGFSKGTGVSMAAPTFGTTVLDSVAVNVAADRSFDGSSKANQGNSLSGSITVTVHEVFPNGVLRVVGEKWLRLNQGDEYIRLTGNVRVDDIEANNKVSSERLANARITYAGKGDHANANEPGWLTKMFNSKWMPF
ncbi:flagellar basal body L-ring protein FlgH [Vibrio owensii]|uniref:flagellar basal body L-ring protein FlgH n=1 Tax=Vibrio owensii TaxID=696485 RepID=UPI0018F14391|nr:flagellar basal body L-ring protein FlgH [Vibrio owensii]